MPRYTLDQIDLEEMDELPQGDLWFERGLDLQPTALAALQPMLERKDVAEIIGELNAQFVTLRERILRRVYKSSLGWTERLYNQEDEDALVAGPAWDYDKEYPDQNYFLEQILPTLLLVANTPEEFRIAAGAAFECFEHLFYSSARSHHGSLFKQFFRPTQEGQGYMWGDVRGQFEHFYRKYGPLGAKTVAKYNGQKADAHYDGMCYADPTFIIEKTLFPAPFDKLPKTYQVRLLEAFIAYGAWHRNQDDMNIIPEGAVFVMEAIRGGKEHLLEAWFKLLKAAPSLGHSDTRMGYPIMHLDPVLADMEAVQELGAPLSGGVLSFGCSIIRYHHNFRRDSHVGVPGFRGNRSRLHSAHPNTLFDISPILENLRKDYSDENYI